MLIEQSISPTTQNIFVDIDPFNEEKVNFSSDIQVSKRWTIERDSDGIRAIWASAKIKMTVYEFALSELDTMRAALECAVTHAERLDAEYPPGSPVKEQEATG
jgi:hypothetical protein